MSIIEEIFSKKIETPAEAVIRTVCGVKKNETVLIVANPGTAGIAQDLFKEAENAGGKPVLVYQQKKCSLDQAEPAVIGALKSEPDVFLSISEGKLGKDGAAIKNPYKTDDGASFDHIFDYLLSGKKTMRAVWTPGLTQDMFKRTVMIDYKQLGERCAKLREKYTDAESVHVTAPNGTDIIVPVKGRKALEDNGNFTQPGSGGNIPAGEVFISPVVGGSSGVIVFDGSMSFSDGDSKLETPITAKVEAGYVTEITGGEEAKRLLKDITAAEKEAVLREKEGRLPEGQGEVYRKNARNIGELGIGLNPAAIISGNMLEDEKAFRTCHFAIGMNYDNDAPALIHFDGVVRSPTIVIKYTDGKETTILDKGELCI